MSSAVHHVQSLTVPIGDLGGRWMLDREVLAAGTAAGHPNGYAYYVVGRGGVLGDVDADVVASAFGFFAPSIVRHMWEAGIAAEPPRAASRRYGQGCADYWRPRLSGFSDADRWVAIARRVATEVDAAGLTLFAGWRGEPLPDDVDGQVALLLHVLRELRGSVHIVAVVAVGMTPLEAVVSAGGAENATRFGWSDPLPDADDRRRAEAEALTDEILTGLYRRVLTEHQLAEFASLTAALAAHIGSR